MSDTPNVVLVMNAVEKEVKINLRQLAIEFEKWNTTGVLDRSGTKLGELEAILIDGGITFMNATGIIEALLHSAALKFVIETTE